MFSGTVLLGFSVQFTFFGLSYLNVRRHTDNFLEKVLNAFTLYFSVLIFSSVLLSLVRSFNLWGLITALGLYTLGTIVYLYQTRLRPAVTELKVDVWEYLTLCFSIAITLVIVYRSWGIIDITHDAVVYVLPRMHLFQQLQSFLYDTYSNIANIWYNQMNFEIIATTWNILTKSIFFSKITSQLFYLWGLLATFLLLQKLGSKKSFAFIGTIIIGLMPVYFLIAHTIKNDSALFAAVVVHIYYYISFWQTNQKRSFIFFLLTTLLCIGIKATILPLTFLLLATIIIKKKGIILEIYTHTSPIKKFCALFLLPIGLHRYLANLIHYGNALITVPEEKINFSFQNAFTALQDAIAAQFIYMTPATNIDLVTETLDNPLAANGGYLMMILFLIAIPGLIFLIKKNALNKQIITIILIQTIIMIIIRPWYPWSTRYIMLIFILIVCGSLYTLQTVKHNHPKLATGLVFLAILITTTQTLSLILTDQSFWLQNRFTNLGVITRYNAIIESREIDPTARLTFIANANAGIYQYIKPSNTISFHRPTHLNDVLNTMRTEDSKYLIITNLNHELLNEVIASDRFTSIHLRNTLADRNNSNVFKLKQHE